MVKHTSVMQPPILPRYIALCGNPGAGKSEVQDILRQFFDVGPVDDGEPLRKFAMTYFGLTKEQVYTQEGKLQEVEVAGRLWQCRKVLGEFGNALEATFGKHIMPHMAMQVADKSGWGSNSFGSVRRDQGLAYKDRGGVVIGIVNPDAPPSGNEFDTFDTTIVDIWIVNDALSKGWGKAEARRDLEHKVWAALTELSNRARVIEDEAA